MTDCSLVYGSLDLLAAPYGAQVGTSFGSWKAIQTETSSLFLDGAAVSGEASANREITLSVRVEASTRPALVAACEALMVEADKQSNTLAFTHDTGTTVVYDTFRAGGPVRTDDESEAWLRRTYELTVPALPFARASTRQTPGLAYPTASDFIGGAATTLDGFVNVAYSGWSRPDEETRDFLQGIPIFVNGGFPETLDADAAPGSVLGGVTAVTNCTVTSTGSERNVNVTASGDAVAKSTSKAATSADAMTVGVALDGAASADRVLQVGVEWFNGSTSLSVEWGTPTYQADDRPVWASSNRPATATHWGYRVKVLSGLASESVRLAWVLAQPQTFASVDVSSGVSIGTLARASFEGLPSSASAAFDVTSTDVSGQTHLQATITRSYNYSLTDTTLAFRLHSAGGKWSAWEYRPDAAEDAAFMTGTSKTLFLPLSTPDLTSDAGAADLAAVIGVSIDHLTIAHQPYQSPLTAVGALRAGLGEGVTPPSQLGAVYEMSGIVGSARTAAQFHGWSTTALSDVLVQSVNIDDGSPLLGIASDTATAVAPAEYGGVYSILASRTDATAPTSPQLVVTQKHNTTTVATKTLAGTTRDGNHYVDFGTCPLPLVAVPDENVSVSYTFALTPTSTGWGDVLVLNVNSPLAMLEKIDPARKNVWIDEPDIVTGIGRVWVGTADDRTDATAPMQAPLLSLPFTVKAPNVKLLVYSTAVGPSASLSYFPRYLVEPG